MAQIITNGRTAENVGEQIRDEVLNALKEAWAIGDHGDSEHDVTAKVDADLGRIIEITFNAGTDDEIRCDVELHWGVVD